MSTIWPGQFRGQHARLQLNVGSDKLVSSHHKVISSILKFSPALPSRPACRVWHRKMEQDEDAWIILDFPCFVNNISSSAVTESSLFISYLIMPIIETCRISLSIKFSSQVCEWKYFINKLFNKWIKLRMRNEFISMTFFFLNNIIHVYAYLNITSIRNGQLYWSYPDQLCLNVFLIDIFSLDWFA